ncbi:hypothetical protein [Vulgatibacter incomptus]|uniref:Uncharacterized protein n=1 Tax=Vulgatibacter incomptus TaxID=1391653 RepID=A0A0K1P963_9BACT|nr:hypothetical protein [Vulgatibacter incomptus]AKU90073.1 hypothetical protein AKJ08_0460 [Vulgatibacter incomptus]
MKRFELKDVLQQIISTAGPLATPITPKDLFQQWWDTANLKPGLGRGPHCDDNGAPVGGSSKFNNFDYECPRGEGGEARVDPFNGPLYKAIGLFNRFDLAPEDGSNCGEYRIVFARDSGRRNLLIFEAVLPNPDRKRGLEGCRPVVEFWAKLSDTSLSNAERGDMLKKFYFDGLSGFEPVVHASHYGAQLFASNYGSAAGGQIRTNQFMEGNWNLREFRLLKDCRCDSCNLAIVPATDKTNPEGFLFNSQSTDWRVPGFQNNLVADLPSLSNPNINEFGYEVKDVHNSGQSVPQTRQHDYNFHADTAFRNRIATAVSASGLTAQHIINRAQALSCAGCHELSNGKAIDRDHTWPRSLGFTHIDENLRGGSRYPLSDALENVFLPYRLEKMEEFLSTLHEAPRELRNLEPRRLPERLIPSNEDCAMTIKIRDFLLIRKVWPWEEVEKLKIDLGPRINIRPTH